MRLHHREENKRVLGFGFNPPVFGSQPTYSFGCRGALGLHRADRAFKIWFKFVLQEQACGVDIAVGTVIVIVAMTNAMRPWHSNEIAYIGTR